MKNEGHFSCGIEEKHDIQEKNKEQPALNVHTAWSFNLKTKEATRAENVRLWQSTNRLKMTLQDVPNFSSFPFSPLNELCHQGEKSSNLWIGHMPSSHP